jgi:hypothetical protein
MASIEPLGFPRSRRRPLRVDPDRSPGWVPGSERLPQPGERIHTHEGTGVVVRLLHKTADGGRVLEVAMDDGRKQPFFAATANVRVQPVVPAEPPADPGGTVGL